VRFGRSADYLAAKMYDFIFQELITLLGPEQHSQVIQRLSTWNVSYYLEMGFE
jgi:hypothetical protein